MELTLKDIRLNAEEATKRAEWTVIVSSEDDDKEMVSDSEGMQTSSENPSARKSSPFAFLLHRRSLTED